MRIERRKPLTAKVGIVGVGHNTYWGQFDGLLDEMHRKLNQFTEKVNVNGVETVTFGLLDNAETAYAALPKMKAADLDLLFVDMVTYATSATFGVLARNLNVPIVLVALQPLRAMPYAQAKTYTQLCNDDFCSVPEFTGVAIRMGHPVADVILGVRQEDAIADAELARWCQIAKVLHDLRHSRVGLMGHVLESMLDMHVDPTAITEAFGCHVALCEPDEILKFYQQEDSEAVEAKKKIILDFFDTPDPVSDPITTKLTAHDLEIAAKAAVALDKFTESRKLDGLAYYYEALPETPMRELVTNLIVGNSLLTIASQKPVLRSLKTYHGKPGNGAGVEFNIKEGPITMLSISVKADGKMKFIIAEGESINGPIPPTGNTNTHGKFKPDIRTFLLEWVKEGPTHHFALGIGHHAKSLVKLATVLGIEAVVVAP